MTLADHVADSVTFFVGSWPFVGIMTAIFTVWIIWNETPYLPHFDTPQLIVMNLCLSFIAGYSAPFILMSQNRQSVKDRQIADETHEASLQDAQETQVVDAHLRQQDEELQQLLTLLIALLQKETIQGVQNGQE